MMVMIQYRYVQMPCILQEIFILFLGYLKKKMHIETDFCTIKTSTTSGWKH